MSAAEMQPQARVSSLPHLQHRWRAALRDDARLTGTHLLVADAYAEHYRADAPRDTYVSPDRLERWTHLGATAIKRARGDLVRFGWLRQTAPAARGRSARYALTISANGGHETTPIPADVPTNGGRVATPKPANGGRVATPSPLPRTPYLPACPPDLEPAPAPAAVQAGREIARDKTRTTPAARAALAEIVPAEVAADPRVQSSRSTLAAVVAPLLAAGWTPAEIGVRVAGSLDGTHPAAVLVARIKALHGLEAPAVEVERRRLERVAEVEAERKARADRRAAEVAALARASAMPADFRAQIRNGARAASSGSAGA